MIGLADCNNFYVSCERVFNPALKGVPVLVLSNNDGCVISRSPEAKSLGIAMGEPLFKLNAIIKIEGIKVLSSNFALYADIAHRVMNTISSLVPSIEIYSIDEAFINFDGIEREKVIELASQIVSKVLKNVGIPISLGLSYTKTLAKVATTLPKRNPYLKGSFLMDDWDEIDKILERIPVGDVWGIGKRSSAKLVTLGIESALKFKSESSMRVNSLMGVRGVRVWSELRGEKCFGIEENSPDKKEIRTSRTFSRGSSNHERVIEALAKFTAYSAQKLRAQGGVTSKVILFFYSSPFQNSGKVETRSIALPLERPTDNTLQLVKRVSSAALNSLTKGVVYKKVGVILSDIVKKTPLQPLLFDSGGCEKGDKLMHSLDEINAKYGRDSVVVATEGVDKRLTKREYLSPKYSTKWEDIIVVNCR
ncbi:MAG: Y-family DNA polymerase [Bacteroidales bacterium]